MKKFTLFFILFFPPLSWASNSIEQGIRLFNQKEYDQAKEILLKESLKGSANATYWLGVVQYRDGEHFEAGDTFFKAAEMGSPWAMAMLFPGKGSKCEYLGWKCDDSWVELAISEWEKLAEKGNGDALLQLQFYQGTWRKYIPFLGRYLINEKYIEALYNGSNNAALYLYQHSGFSLEERINYLLVAANRGYAPAMVILYYHEDFLGSNEASEWINKALDLGYPKAAESLFYNYHLRREKNKNDIKKSYYYNLVIEALGGNNKDKESLIMEIVRVDGSLVLDEDGDFVYSSLITKKEQDELDRQVEEFVKDIKINLFLDETSIEFF